MYICIMGRKPSAHSNSMYSLVTQSINGMEMGETRVIGTPSDLPFFRKYLSEIGKRSGQRFTTRSIAEGLQIMRVKYYNTYSKEVE